MANLTTIIGNLGSGKTLFLARLGTRLKRPIYSNFKLKLPNFRPLELIDLIDMDTNINIFIDEAYAWIDSRVSGSAINRYCSYIVLQSRKTFTDVFLTAQMFSTVDIRFRIQSNIIVTCKAIGKQRFYNATVPQKFQYRIFNKETRKSKLQELYFEDAIKYFKIYDTLEIIDSSEKESLEYHLIVKNPKRLIEKIESIAKTIEKDVNKITHPTVNLALMMNAIPLQYEPHVYNYMTGKSKIDKNDSS
jgi:hypothetical protein